MTRNIWADSIRSLFIGVIIALTLIVVMLPLNLWLPGWEGLPEWMHLYSIFEIIAPSFMWFVFVSVPIGLIVFMWRNL